MLDKCQHKDMNITRGIDHARKFKAAKREYVDEVFGPRQLYLHLLATHPDYQLHGAGTRLVGRGIEVARKEGLNLTLVAQPTAAGFYTHIGFSSTGNITITSVDEDEKFTYPVMAYNFTSR
jgi:GNAT superfamily N-acetyltransferase